MLLIFYVLALKVAYIFNILALVAYKTFAYEKQSVKMEQIKHNSEWYIESSQSKLLSYQRLPFISVAHIICINFVTHII